MFICLVFVMWDVQTHDFDDCWVKVGTRTNVAPVGAPYANIT